MTTDPNRPSSPMKPQPSWGPAQQAGRLAQNVPLAIELTDLRDETGLDAPCAAIARGKPQAFQMLQSSAQHRACRAAIVGELAVDKAIIITGVLQAPIPRCGAVLAHFFAHALFGLLAGETSR